MSAATALAAEPTRLQLSARQRDMLSHMGLPMQGWPLAQGQADMQPKLGATTQALVIDTMNPAVRSLRLADLKKADSFGALPTEKISIETPNSGVKPAWKAHKNIVNPSANIVANPEASTEASALRLWSLDGVEQTAPSQLGQKLLLLLEGSAAQTDFPVLADAQGLLRNILAALQCPPEGVLLCALPLPQQGDQGASWLAQIAAWQPALLLVLGRNASRAVLGGQAALQAGSLSALRGQTFDVAGVAARVSYPLDYLLRKPQAKAGAWQDWLAAKWQWDARLTH